MKNFKIVTDSGCDLSRDMLNSLEVEYLGLVCDIEGTKIIEDGVKSLDYREFYGKLREGAMPKTSQINPTRFFKKFENIIRDDYDILYIALSSGLSGTYDSALTAKKELIDLYPESNITIIDSKAASGGQGLLVYIAAKLKAEGKSIKEIRVYVEECIKKLYHFFTVKDLKHLERGGRISTSSAIIGSMLNINPILTITENGILESIGKIRGGKKAIKELIKNIDKNINGESLDTIFISHADNDKDVEYLCAQLKENLKVNEIIINYMSLIIGSHTGQGAVGIYFLGKEKRKDETIS